MARELKWSSHGKMDMHTIVVYQDTIFVHYMVSNTWVALRSWN